MKCIFSRMARAAGGGCRRRLKPRCCGPPPTRQSVGSFEAVRLRDGQFVFARATNRFDAQTPWSFLDLLRQRSRRAGRAVVLMIDNAKHHHAHLHRPWRQEQAPAFVRDYLPPHSPDRNPIERGGRLVRKLRLHDEYLPTPRAVIDAVEGPFAAWGSRNETLRRLGAI